MGSARLYVGTTDGLHLLVEREDGWRSVRHAFPGAAVRALLALDAETLLAAVDGRPPQQSFDGGIVWSDAPGASVEPVGLRAATLQGPVALANPRLMGATAYARLGGRQPVLVGAGAGGMLLFRSVDDGIHWEPAALPGGVGLVRALVPGVGGGMWAGTDSGRLLHSADRGMSWREAGRVPSGVLCMAAV